MVQISDETICQCLGLVPLPVDLLASVPDRNWAAGRMCGPIYRVFFSGAKPLVSLYLECMRGSKPMDTPQVDSLWFPTQPVRAHKWHSIAICHPATWWIREPQLALNSSRAIGPDRVTWYTGEAMNTVTYVYKNISGPKTNNGLNVH